jgi:hypothetical protein
VADFQDRLDALSHLTIDVDGQVLHVVHARGQGPSPMPLVLTHGWPGSFCEYLYLIPLLTDPQAHGGDPDDARTPKRPYLGLPFPSARLTKPATRRANWGQACPRRVDAANSVSYFGG